MLLFITIIYLEQHYYYDKIIIIIIIVIIFTVHHQKVKSTCVVKTRRIELTTHYRKKTFWNSQATFYSSILLESTSLMHFRRHNKRDHSFRQQIGHLPQPKSIPQNLGWFPLFFYRSQKNRLNYRYRHNASLYSSFLALHSTSL